MEQDAAREVGTVSWYNSEKGYGFIQREDHDDLFFHANNRTDEAWTPQEGDKVTFEVGEGRKGPAGMNVSLEGSEAQEDDANDYA